MVQEDKSWVDELMELSTKDDVLVKMIQDEQEYIFQIKASKFLDKYILSLTDITQISQQSQQYKHEANYDELTQIYNRNMLHRVMNKKISDQQEEKYSFVFMIMDIDFFKKVNDTYGHLVGDEVLKSLTALIKKHIRTEDTFARWGGEEFILVLNAEMNKGLEIAENLRNFIEVEHFDTVKNITCSFGITEYREKDTLDTLIHRADDALYEAKATGRNRVCQR
jgi:diguanylate cyclase (GGDEF)-like protein